MTNTIAMLPTEDEVQTLLKGPADQPVVMVNLLRFKATADAPNKGLSGEEAYARYAAPVIAFVMSNGGRLIWSGRVDSQLIGEGGEEFQMVALVEYPSRKAFIEIMTDPKYEEISVHRASGLEGQWLIATTTVG